QPHNFKDLACVSQSHNKIIVVQFTNSYFSTNSYGQGRKEWLRSAYTTHRVYTQPIDDSKFK
ncbi:hypothetical protein A2U01_0018659, partial [Trifolium medium]|nr:hypothetical protein [Trifolium medium]